MDCQVPLEQRQDLRLSSEAVPVKRSCFEPDGRKTNGNESPGFCSAQGLTRDPTVPFKITTEEKKESHTTFVCILL